MPLMIAVLTLFAAFMATDADAETDAERLAKMFSPILILTEETSTNYDATMPIRVIRPEPVGIVFAQSADSLRFSYYEQYPETNPPYEGTVVGFKGWNPPLTFPNVKKIQVQTVTNGQTPHTMSSLSNAIDVSFDRPGEVALSSDGDEGLAVDDVLTATPMDANRSASDWEDSDNVSWQWQRKNVNADTWTNIGRDENIYTLTYGEVGKQIRATVAYDDGIGTAEDMAASDLEIGAKLAGAAERSVDSSASVQAQTPTQAEIDSLSAKMEARINRNLRIAKKVAAGTASGGVFTFSAIGFMALTMGGGYSGDDLAELGNFLASVAIGCSVGFPLGVTLVDPYDSLSETLFSGVIPGAIGMSLVGSGDGSGFLVAYVGPIIGSLYASEKSRQPPQDHRVSFGLAPTLNGGLSAVAQLRF